MRSHVRQAFEDIARHSGERVWPALLKFCELAASRGSITEDDAEEIYVIVRKAYERRLGRTDAWDERMLKVTIAKLKRAINSGSKVT